MRRVLDGGECMPKINYQYEKRQKDLAKKKKQEEKRLKRANRSASKADGTADAAPEGGEPSAS
jgi:hypothetical protein